MSQTATMTKQIPRPVNLISSQDEHQLMILSRENSWGFTVLGHAPLPEQPVRLGEWLIIPATQDSSNIPHRTLQRVQAIFEAGIRPKGFVLVHEAPPLLSAPGTAKPAAQPEIDWIALSEGLSKGLFGFLAVGATAISAIAGLLLSGTLLVGAALIDPILIAITEDDVWVEIDRWYV